jgi:hypothetical protein
MGKLPTNFGKLYKAETPEKEPIQLIYMCDLYDYLTQKQDWPAVAFTKDKILVTKKMKYVRLFYYTERDLKFILDSIR